MGELQKNNQTKLYGRVGDLLASGAYGARDISLEYFPAEKVSRGGTL